MFTKDELINITGAEVLKDDCIGGNNFSISTDTRTISCDNIYVPLKGESFDGENFIGKIFEKGAIAYFTSQNIVYPESKLVLRVSDTLSAYLKLAEYYRKKINPITVGVTGSSGKPRQKK